MPPIRRGCLEEPQCGRHPGSVRRQAYMAVVGDIRSSGKSSVASLKRGSSTVLTRSSLLPAAPFCRWHSTAVGKPELWALGCTVTRTRLRPSPRPSRRRGFARCDNATIFRPPLPAFTRSHHTVLIRSKAGHLLGTLNPVPCTAHGATYGGGIAPPLESQAM